MSLSLLAVIPLCNNKVTYLWFSSYQIVEAEYESIPAGSYSPLV